MNHSRLEPYPLSVYDLDQALVRAGGGMDSLMKRFNQYAKSELKAHPRITVIGGSMTEGGSLDLTPFGARSSTPCLKDKIKRRTANWPGQLGHLLSVFYGKQINVTENSRAGSSLRWAAVQLREIVPLDT